MIIKRPAGPVLKPARLINDNTASVKRQIPISSYFNSDERLEKKRSKNFGNPYHLRVNFYKVTVNPFICIRKDAPPMFWDVEIETLKRFAEELTVQLVATFSKERFTDVNTEC